MYFFLCIISWTFPAFLPAPSLSGARGPVGQTLLLNFCCFPILNDDIWFTGFDSFFPGNELRSPGSHFFNGAPSHPEFALFSEDDLYPVAEWKQFSRGINAFNCDFPMKVCQNGFRGRIEFSAAIGCCFRKPSAGFHRVSFLSLGRVYK